MSRTTGTPPDYHVMSLGQVPRRNLVRRRSSSRRARGTIALVVAGVGLGACSGGSSGPPANAVATVEVTPSSVTRQVGETVQLGVALKNASGALVSGHTVTWQSLNTVVATVSASGLVSALTIGSATISATAGGVTGNATITVEGVPVASVTVSPSTDTLLVAETVQLNAELKDASGGIITGRSVTWTSANSTIASVNQQGLVTAVGDGTVNITASSGLATGSAAITVFGPCSIALTTPINVGDVVNGTLSTSDCQIEDGSYLDGYSIMVPQDTPVQIDMTAAFDTWLELYELVNPSTLAGRAVNDDIDPGVDTNSRILFTLLGGAQYYIIANSFDGFVTGPYQLTVAVVNPDVVRLSSGVLKKVRIPLGAALRLRRP